MDRPSVLTIGTFDLFHHGHMRFLNMCRRLGRLTVAVNTDEFVEQFKGRRPVQPLADRIVSVARYCRTITHKSGPDAKPTIEEVNPDILAIGTDWAFKDYCAQLGLTQAWLDGRGIVLCYLPYTPGISTSLIRAQMEAKASQPSPLS